MDLYVDIGNSAVKWANAKELETGNIQAVSSKEIDTMLTDRWQSLAAPERVCLSSVLQESKLAWLKAWILRHWRIEPVMAVTRAQELGVTNGYREPTQLGVDRWLALLSARSLTQGPVLVVDCGTATTIDAMDETGHHLGGVILPGLQLFRRCLTGNTDLPPLNESDAIEYFATDTATGITSGAACDGLFRGADDADAANEKQGEGKLPADRWAGRLSIPSTRCFTPVHAESSSSRAGIADGCKS